ncbi:hypothetical protein MRX96_027613 [Rhipicephalus microplus]
MPAGVAPVCWRCRWERLGRLLAPQSRVSSSPCRRHRAERHLTAPSWPRGRRQVHAHHYTTESRAARAGAVVVREAGIREKARTPSPADSPSLLMVLRDGGGGRMYGEEGRETLKRRNAGSAFVALRFWFGGTKLADKASSALACEGHCLVRRCRQ